MAPVTHHAGRSGSPRRQRLPSVRRVRDLIRSAILAGELDPGPLPSEQALITEYDTSRGVIRDVLDLLRDEGLIERLQGAGTFVTIPALSSFDIDLLDGHLTGIHPSRMYRTVLHVEEIPAPAYIADRLGVDPDSTVLYQERLNSLDGNPLTLRTSWMPAHLGDRHIEIHLDSDVPALKALESAVGNVVDHAELKVEACLADPTSAPVLGIELGRPLLLVERLAVDSDGCVLELSYSRMRGDRVLLHTNLHRSAGMVAGNPY